MAKIKIDPSIALRTLSFDEAIELLEPHKEKSKMRIHTMEKWAFGVMGCDVDLSSIKKRLKASKEIYISDTIGGHGVVFNDTKGWLFLATSKTKFDGIKKKRKIK